MIAAPAGFVRHARGDALVVVAEELAAAAFAAGLDRPWDVVAPRPAGPGTGRGPRGLVRLASGDALLVKQYLRGGVPAKLNPDRYFGLRRFASELAVGRAARAAGLPVGETRGVVFRPARPGWRAWGLVRLIDEATDLARLFGAAPGRADRVTWQRALAVIEAAHEAGLEHGDLNLGNLVARPDGAVFIVDLDRARWWNGPVPARQRARVMARLARSVRKVLGPEGAALFV